MAKRQSGDDVAAQIAAFIGRSLGRLSNRKDALQRELADIERQIDGVRDSVMSQFAKGGLIDDSRKAAKRVARRAKRVMSPEARAKMAAAAKRRWAKAKSAGKNSLG